ncbi:MAG TPA: sugar phosphate isomerase/epimerase family protein [Bacillales bacterium]|nr:sugar phosphate isomerase/epimerase family protein [Bacillales bacterium]
MKIGLATASYFAKASNYQTSMDDWTNAERRVIESFSLKEFNSICSAISNAGFRYIELWMGHAFPKFMTPYFAEEMKKILAHYQLEIIGYTCHLGDPINAPRWTELCFETCQMFDVKLITSGVSQEGASKIYRYCEEYDMKVAVENHPEKHPNEIRTVIGDYGDRLGAGVDTGWFGTQGFPAHEALISLKDYLLNVHLKDVKEAGAHHPTALGSGVVDMERCIRTLKELGYDDRVSIEHESEDHDPTKDVRHGRMQVEDWLRI